jgi:hypothetical protein
VCSHSDVGSTAGLTWDANGVAVVAISHSGAAISVGSLSPRAATRVPQTSARVGEGWGEGPFVGRLPRP